VAAVAIEAGFDGGHGSHWDAVLEDPGELPRLVSEAFKRGTVSEGAVVLLQTGAADARVRTLALGDRGLEARIIELTIASKPKPSIATVFPHLTKAGNPVRVVPIKVIEWGREGFEAEVEVAIEGEEAAVTFFAVDYLENRSRYRKGGPLDVALGAVAYTSGIISPAARMEEVAGKKVDVSKASIVAALKDSERAPYYDDDFFLQGPVLSCAPFVYPPWGEGAVLRLDLDPIGATPVFVRKKDFPHGWPKAGEFVAAYTWMQGRLAPEKA
jgi:hypothetical protein